MDLMKEAFQEFASGKWPSTDLLTLLVSRLIGYCIMMGASIIKVPQIMSIYKSKSVEGLSVLAFELEMFVPAIHSAYGLIMGLDISAYGEAVLSFIQAVILLTAIYSYGGMSKARSSIIFALLAVGGGLVFSDNVSKEQITMAYIMNQGFFTIARAAQIRKNYSQKGTGQLSLVSNMLLTFGCVMRIFTSLRENTGTAFILGFVQGSLLNGIVVAQIAFYKKKEKVAKKKD